MRYMILIGVLGLSACVSEKATLTNSEGNVVHCDNWGFGLIGTPVAMVGHANCMKDAHAAGYSEYPGGKPSSVAAANPSK